MGSGYYVAKICAMEDTSPKTKKEKAFQKQLADLEGYVSYVFIKIGYLIYFYFFV
jgi:hypothetical protein